MRQGIDAELDCDIALMCRRSRANRVGVHLTRGAMTNSDGTALADRNLVRRRLLHPIA